MNIIVFRGDGTTPSRYRLGKREVRRFVAIAAAGLALLVTAAVYGGRSFSTADQQALEQLAQWQQELERGRAELDAMRQRHDDHIDALALKLGELQARSVRMESLGARLTQVGKLTDGEFNFLSAPPVGGPEQAPLLADIGAVDLAREIHQFEARFDAQARQLEILESLIAGRELDETLMPSGKPIAAGWQSSRFGKRVDPFTGEMAVHAGVDFAGPLNAEILAVADGVVTWSGSRPQYGNTVEVDHGNGYVTRYAHNAENRVSIGQRVAAGDVLGIMGSTGRATGAHVHFEVLLDGRRINPAEVIAGIR